MNDEAIEWGVLEFEPHSKGADWYWILGILTIVGALIAIVLSNTLFAILIVLSGFIISVYASKHPEMLYCTINRRGVFVNKEIHLFRDIDTFWVDETRPDKPKLLLTLKNKLSLQVAIPLGSVDLDEVHEYISAHVHEEEQSESITEQIMEWLKI